MTLPERRARSARAVGYGGFALGALSVGSFFLVGPTGAYSLFAGTAFALATLLTGIVAVVMNRRALAPQPVQPVLAMLFGVVLVAGYVFVWWGLLQLAHMH